MSLHLDPEAFSYKDSSEYWQRRTEQLSHELMDTRADLRDSRYLVSLWRTCALIQTLIVLLYVFLRHA